MTRPCAIALPRPRVVGVTLVELLVVVSIVGVLAAIAVPMFSGAREAARSGAAQQALAATMAAAASRATLDAHEVVVCPGVPHACSGGIDWHRGWIAWRDVDGDRLHDPGEALVERVAGFGGHVRLRSTVGRTRLVFQPNGGSAGTNATFTLCDGRGASHAVALVLNNSGRLRSAVPEAGAALACVEAN